MKKNILISTVLLIQFCILGLFSQEKIYQYKIKVSNKFIYVRVFNKGKLVDNLNKEDFILYENGKERPIESVDIIYKTLNQQNIGLEASIKNNRKPRYFVITFDISSYGENIKKGLDYLFNKVLREKDKLMFMSGHYFFKEDELKNKARIEEKIIRILKREAILSKMEMTAFFTQIKSIKFAVDEYIRSQHSQTQNYMDPRKLQMILDKTITLIRWYKQRYLIPDIDKFYYFSQYLNNIKLKKWVLNFYQIKKNPIPRELIDFWSESGIVWASNKLMEELSFPQDFPSEEITKLFYKVDTTFYTFLLLGNSDTLEKDYTFKPIYTDLEKTLKEISFSTGGDVILSNNLNKSFDNFIKKKDILYLINYKPSKKNPKIKIKIKNKRYKIKYDPNQFSDYIKDYMKKKRKENPEVEIFNFSFKHNTLYFGIRNFKMLKNKQRRKTGKILVSINITSPEGEIVYNKKRVLEFFKSKGKLSIRFTNLTKGIYYLYLDVYDVLSNKTSSRFEVIEIKQY